jgi:hypothetical protein
MASFGGGARSFFGITMVPQKSFTEEKNLRRHKNELMKIRSSLEETTACDGGRRIVHKWDHQLQ